MTPAKMIKLEMVIVLIQVFFGIGTTCGFEKDLNHIDLYPVPTNARVEQIVTLMQIYMFSYKAPMNIHLPLTMSFFMRTL